LETHSDTYSKHNFGSLDEAELRKHAAWTVSSKVLSVKRLKDSKWNWDDFKNMNKGQNGWYIQTTYAKLYNLIEKNSQNARPYYRIENFQDSDFETFIERKYWKQLIQHLIRYKQVREKAVEELETSPLFQFAIRLSQEGSRRLYCTSVVCSNVFSCV